MYETEQVWLYIASIIIISFGCFILLKPKLVAATLKSFYKKYPLVRYAGDDQLTTRPAIVRLLGVTIIITGVICMSSL